MLCHYLLRPQFMSFIDCLWLHACYAFIWHTHMCISLNMQASHIISQFPLICMPCHHPLRPYFISWSIFCGSIHDMLLYDIHICNIILHCKTNFEFIFYHRINLLIHTQVITYGMLCTFPYNNIYDSSVDSLKNAHNIYVYAMTIGL